jgi:hypothetical protein
MEMNRIRITILAIALAVIPLSAVVPSASAQATQIRIPISFTLTPAGCPNLNVTVVGSGEEFFVINNRTDQNGVEHIEMNSLATGTASDSDGVSYIFNYHDHASLAVPPGGFPVQAFFNDHFNLVGNGRANRVQVGITAQITIYSFEPRSFTIDLIRNQRGEIFLCDPI